MRSFLLALLVAFSTVLSAQQYVLPAAGSVPGQFGTYFRSDVAVWNLRDASQRVLVSWLPQGETGVGIAPVELVVPAFSGIQDEDFVGNRLHRQGLGAISFLAVRADGTPDTGAKLNIQSRIWTPQPDTRGFTSQSFDAVRITQLTGDKRIITNQRNEFRYRMNVGIVNLDPQNPHTWNVTSGPNVIPVTLDPLSMKMFPVPSYAYGTSAPVVRVDMLDGGSATGWVAFGSSIENVSGDAWTSLAYAASLP